MNLEVKTNLAAFNATLAKYSELSRRTPAETLLKKGTSLAHVLAGRLALLKPPKGRTRAERLAAIKSGGGIRIRPAIRARVFRRLGVAGAIGSHRLGFTGKKGLRFTRGKRRLNVQAELVKAELALRESGRGYLSLAARMKFAERELMTGHEVRQLDRIKREIGRAGLRAKANDSTLTFTFRQEGIAEGLSRPKGEAAVAASLAEVRADMLTFIARKMSENARASGLK